jgi:hypothetical protein
MHYVFVVASPECGQLLLHELSSLNIPRDFNKGTERVALFVRPILFIFLGTHLRLHKLQEYNGAENFHI